MGSGTALHNAFNKYGIENFSKNILEVCSTEEEAYNKEMEYIHKYDACNSKQYYNIICGGKGVGSGEQHPMYNKKHSIKSRIKMSESRIGLYSGENHGMYGRKHSADSKDKMKKSRLGRFTNDNHPRAKRVICLTTNERFNCIKQAAEKYNLSKAHISSCCKGKIKSCGKHPTTKHKMIWMYEEDYKNNILK